MVISGFNFHEQTLNRKIHKITHQGIYTLYGTFISEKFCCNLIFAYDSKINHNKFSKHVYLVLGMICYSKIKVPHKQLSNKFCHTKFPDIRVHVLVLLHVP